MQNRFLHKIRSSIPRKITRRDGLKFIRLLIVFILPAYFSFLALHEISQCFNLKIGIPSNPPKSQNAAEFQKKVLEAAQKFDQINERLPSISLYDLYFKNSAYYVIEEENVLNASGTIIKVSNPKQKLEARYECIDENDLKQSFAYNEERIVGSSLRLNNITQYSEKFRESCKLAYFEYDPPEIPGGGSLGTKISIQGNICFKAYPTKLSYLIVYAIFYTIIIGGIHLLKQGLKFVNKGLAEDTDDGS